MVVVVVLEGSLFGGEIAAVWIVLFTVIRTRQWYLLLSEWRIVIFESSGIVTSVGFHAIQFTNRFTTAKFVDNNCEKVSILIIVSCLGILVGKR